MTTSETVRRSPTRPPTSAELRSFAAAQAAASVQAAPPVVAPAPTPPERPALHGKDAAPILVKLPPPFFVRASQTAWILSLFTGGAAIVYLFIVRQTQLPLIAAMAKTVDGTRAEVTYSSAANILFWSVFGVSVAVVLLQIVFQVSFSNRRPHARWWQFGSILFQTGLVLIVGQMVAIGERGEVLQQVLSIQLGLAALGLLLSLLPQALRWTARRYDVRRGPVAPAGGTQL
ncbi:hypothetical protein [uncultured Microbacterium sp.]|uniref:hypothetical protein n=1 Tax=uncultured Microbacterium sp. TaxID=191216 RepID=UPI0035CBA167